jgi:hypothetical protein
MLLCVLTLALSACADPCEELSERVCKDLGADCESWRSGVAQDVVQLKKDPKTAGPAPKLAQLQMDGGMPVWLAYAIMPLSIIGMFGYFMFWNRRAKRPQ